LFADTGSIGYIFHMGDAHVLILNRNYQPVNVAHWKRAMVLLYAGGARALDDQFRLFDFESWASLSAEYGDDAVGAVGCRIRVPRILVLQAYDRLPRMRVRFSRHNIFRRDDHSCQYCGFNGPRSDLNLDHVIPKSQGGKTHWENVVASCIPCNSRKGGRTPEQAGMRLRKRPKRPTWTELARPRRFRPQYREWVPFLDPVDASYWNTELESD
jgi:5-methylcytosine-specific restriction endonuclease McrA